MKTKDRIQRQFQFMSSVIEDGSKSQVLNASISKWAVSQHIDHLLKAAERILTQLKSKENRATKPKNILGKIILFVGVIPKGRESPRAVAGELKSQGELAESLSKVRSLLEAVDFRTLELTTFDHHVFGGLNGKEWLRFMVIHNNHHVKIIKKILSERP